MKIRILLLTLVFICASITELQAVEEQARQQSLLVSVLYLILPFFFCIVPLWWYLRKYQKSSFVQRSVEHYERLEQNLNRIEQIWERIAVALEKKGKDGI